MLRALLKETRHHEGCHRGQGVKAADAVAVRLPAAVAVLPLLLPPSAVSWILPWSQLDLKATEISSAKVCGAGECREVSDPEAAKALAVGPRPRGTDAPVRGLPWYKSTLTIRAEERRGARPRPVTVVPSAGLMGWGTALSGDPAQREQKGLREALSRAYAPPGEHVSGRRRGRRAGRPRRRGRCPVRGHPGAGERRPNFGSSRWAAAC